MQKNHYLNIDVSTGTYQLQDAFDKFTIPQQWQVIKEAFKEVQPVVIDLKNISECDSALIALLVEIKRLYADISIANAPDNLVQLLDLYQVKTLLF